MIAFAKEVLGDSINQELAMCLTVFLAQLIGCFLFLVGLSMLAHQQRFKKTVNEFLSIHPLVAISGWLSVLFGLLIVISHNIWVSQWPVLITLFGWFLLLQGLLRIFFPDSFAKFVKELMAKSGYAVVSWVWLLVGLYLIWAGFSN